MTESKTGRMLLSHNFDISEDILPQLSREEFTQVFAEGLSKYPNLQFRQLSHAHWMVEILFSSQDYSPPEVGEMCAKSLLEKRRSQERIDDYLPDILILGGIKKTPPISNSPDTLQTGEWGVDVVETQSAKQFLAGIGWEEMTKDKTIKDIFKIELIAGV